MNQPDTETENVRRALDLLERLGAVRRVDSDCWVHEAEPAAQEAAERELALEIGEEAAADAVRRALDETSVETPPHFE